MLLEVEVVEIVGQELQTQLIAQVMVVMVQEMEAREMEMEKEEMIMRVAFLVEVDPQLDRGWLIFIETGRRGAPRWGQAL